MKISFKNLGHIKEAVFEDSQLVIIVGDNGTGKTLLLEAVSVVSEVIDANMEELITDIIKKFDFIKDSDITDSAIKLENQLTSHFEIDKGGHISRLKDEIIFNLEFGNIELINDFIQQKMYKIINEAKYLVKQRVLFDENSDLEINLIEIPLLSKETDTIKSEGILFGETIILQSLSLKSVIEIINLKSHINKEISMYKDLTVDTKNFINFLDYTELSKTVFLNSVKIYFRKFFGNYFNNANILYLPSERNTFMKNAISKIVEQDNRSLGIRYSEHKFIKEFLLFRDSVNKFKDRFSISTEYIDLIGGIPEFDEEGEVSRIVIDGKQIDKVLFSTKVNRLIPYLMVFQPLMSYKTLIIEEPEAHLSLKTMKHLLEFFKSLTERHQLYITTHSDVFFTKLNNFILQNPQLSVKVYELVSDSNNSYLNEITKSEYGYKIELFADELDQLFNETIEIQNNEEHLEINEALNSDDGDKENDKIR